MIVLTLYSRPGCHLCDDMKAVIDGVLAPDSGAPFSPPVSLEVVDVSGNLDLEVRYGLDIPVLTINGEPAAMHRITERELRRMLGALGG